MLAGVLLIAGGPARGFFALQDTLTPNLIGSGLTVVFVIGRRWLCVLRE